MIRERTKLFLTNILSFSLCIVFISLSLYRAGSIVKTETYSHLHTTHIWPNMHKYF